MTCTRRCPHITISAHTLLSGHCITWLLHVVSDMSMCRLCRPASSSRLAPRSSHTHPRGWRDWRSTSDGCWCRMSSTSMSDSHAMQTPSPGFASSSASRCRRSCSRPCVPHRVAMCVHDRHMSHTFLYAFESASVVTCVCLHKHLPIQDDDSPPAEFVPVPDGIDHTLPDGVMLQVRLHLVNGRYQVRPLRHCTAVCRCRLTVCTQAYAPSLSHCVAHMRCVFV